MKIELKKTGSMIQVEPKHLESFKSLSDGIYMVDLKDMSVRTTKQNAAIHVLFSLTSNALNDAGISINKVLNRKLEAKIIKAFDWGRGKLKVIPRAEIVLNKMQDWILQQMATELPWTDTLVKDALWRPLQVHITGKTSTTRLTRSEIDKVYDVYNNVLAGHGIHIPFPDRSLWDKEKDEK